VKSGGLNESLQHLLNVSLLEAWKLISFATTNSNKTKALCKFCLNIAVGIDS
jgi:hypothetical protein